MLLIIIALLAYSAFIMWSASGQDPEMMERKLGQIATGFVVMIVMAQIPLECMKTGHLTCLSSALFYWFLLMSLGR